MDFESGSVSYIQAKTRLRAGNVLDAALAQWADAGRSGLDVETDHLLLVGAVVEGVARHLADALRLFKSEKPGSPSNKHQIDALDRLDKALADLSESQKEDVLRCASILELRITDDGNHVAQAALAHVVAPKDTGKAWRALVPAAGRAARIRGGRSLAGWLSELTSAGVALAPRPQTPAAELSQRAAAFARHGRDLRARRDSIDLRALGAEIAPIPFLDIDAGLSVRADGVDGTAGSDGEPLVWAFLRHGRAVLTGLPGAGKSHALRRLAADLMDIDSDTMSIVVRLADVDTCDRAASFRERLIASALLEAPTEDAPLLRKEILERLDDGRVVVLLDGLDETYERRGAVVSELSRFLGTVHHDVDLLLSTRDVAYGQAETLGWPALHLQPPQSVERTVLAVLTAYSVSRLPEGRQTAWIDERKRWVNQALNTAGTLKETPLFPVLLAIIAAERLHGDLPTKRAEVLQEVIKDVITRHERNRVRPLAIATLSGVDAANALLEGFETEAGALLDSDLTCAKSAVALAVAATLHERFGLAPGLAAAGAESVIRIWDETGIFVLSGGAEIVSPRLALYAEIGDARAAARQPAASASGWVAQRIAGGRIESVVLASGLSTDIATAFAVYAAAEPNHQVLHAFWTAIAQGAEPASGHRAGAVRALLLDVTHGDRQSWKSWTTLAQAVPPEFSRDELTTSLNAFPTEHASIGRGFLALQYESPEELVKNPGELLTALSVQRLPKLEGRAPSETATLASLGVSSFFTDVVVDAATILVGQVPGTEVAVAAHLGKYASQRMIGGLEPILRRRGFGRLVDDRLRDQIAMMQQSIRGLGLDLEAPDRLIEFLATAEPSAITRSQSRRLGELGEFLETLNVNAGGSFWLRRERLTDQVDVTTLIAMLGGFDLSVIAAQAQILQDRHTIVGEGHAPLWALIHGTKARELDNWGDVTNQEEAVRLLIRMLHWSLHDAAVAATALWDSPVEDMAAPALREALSSLRRSPAHLRIGALILCSLRTCPEPAGWETDDDPVLREVAASWSDPVDHTGAASSAIRLFLDDADGHVQEAALDVLVRSSASDRQDLLLKVAERSDPGWMCTTCRTRNRAGESSCTGRPDSSPCRIVGPRPSKRAREQLAADETAS